MVNCAQVEILSSLLLYCYINYLHTLAWQSYSMHHTSRRIQCFRLTSTQTVTIYRYVVILKYAAVQCTCNRCIT